MSRMKRMGSILFSASLCLLGSSVTNAGEVTVFGAIDLGLKYQKSKGHDAIVSMDSGTYAGSRWGLKGKEELNEDLSVAFHLESGFDADNGNSKGRLFNRGSLLLIQSKKFGTLGFGRTSAFTSASGDYGWMWQVDAFEGAYLDAGIQASQFNMWGWRDNVVLYISPQINNWELGLQYSLSGDDGANEVSDDSPWHDSDHYWNAALRYKSNNINFVFGAEGMDYGAKSQWHQSGKPFTVKFGTAVKFPIGTAFFGYNFSKHQRYVLNCPMLDYGSDLSPAEGSRGIKLNSFYVGFKYPIWGGEFIAQYQYVNGKDEGRPDASKFSRNVGAVGYHYFLSNHTMLYAVGSYAHGSGLLSGDKAGNRYVGHLGMVHFF